MENLNLWRRGPLQRNPYRQTAFRLARVPREVTDRSMVVELVAQTRQVSELDPQAHLVDGHPVSASDLNQAELVLLAPSRRVLEELLEPGVESVARDRLRGLAREAAERLAPRNAGARHWTRPGVVEGWLAEAFREELEAGPGDAGGAGTGEADLLPPWGRA